MRLDKIDEFFNPITSYYCDSYRNQYFVDHHRTAFLCHRLKTVFHLMQTIVSYHRQLFLLGFELFKRINAISHDYNSLLVQILEDHIDDWIGDKRAPEYQYHGDQNQVDSGHNTKSCPHRSKIHRQPDRQRKRTKKHQKNDKNENDNTTDDLR